mmetsp:Transcript_37622/g.100067  ORF Transcript_37622/g.100067 Transcript_37622/m.100067 type:complete len:337 (-) Transcript_37622:404-1414(-)
MLSLDVLVLALPYGLLLGNKAMRGNALQFHDASVLRNWVSQVNGMRHGGLCKTTEKFSMRFFCGTHRDRVQVAGFHLGNCLRNLHLRTHGAYRFHELPAEPFLIVRRMFLVMRRQSRSLGHLEVELYATSSVTFVRQIPVENMWKEHGVGYTVRCVEHAAELVGDGMDVAHRDSGERKASFHACLESLFPCFQVVSMMVARQQMLEDSLDRHEGVALGISSVPSGKIALYGVRQGVDTRGSRHGLGQFDCQFWVQDHLLWDEANIYDGNLLLLLLNADHRCACHLTPCSSRRRNRYQGWELSEEIGQHGDSEEALVFFNGLGVGQFSADNLGTIHG